MVLGSLPSNNHRPHPLTLDSGGTDIGSPAMTTLPQGLYHLRFWITCLLDSLTSVIIFHSFHLIAGIFTLSINPSLRSLGPPTSLAPPLVAHMHPQFDSVFQLYAPGSSSTSASRFWTSLHQPYCRSPPKT